MKVLLLILAVVYCINGHALQKDNGLRPAKRAVDEQGAGQVNSDSYSIHKSREISKSAYLPPVIRDLPQSSEQFARQGITQLKPVSTKLTSVTQQNSNVPVVSNQPLQAGFSPVSNAFGAPVKEQSLLSQGHHQQIPQQTQLQASSNAQRAPHENYGIPPPFTGSKISFPSESNSGYPSNIPQRTHGAIQRSQSNQIVQHQRTHQNQHTEAIFTQKNLLQQNYQAPGYLPPSQQDILPQAVQQQQPYEAPGYLPPAHEEVVPQTIQQQSAYEAPGYLPPNRIENTSGTSSAIQPAISNPSVLQQQVNGESPLAPVQQNSQSGYSYQNNNEQIASQIATQHQSGYAYNKQTQQQISALAQQSSTSSQTQSGYGYQQTNEQVLPEAITPQQQSGYSYQHNHEEVAPNVGISQQHKSQGAESGYSYSQNGNQISNVQQLSSTSAVASSKPVLPLPPYPPNRAPYQHQQLISSALNNPRPLTSYDPPPSGIPEGLIQSQDEGLSIIREPEGPQPYDQVQPVYRPEYNEGGGQEGYDYSPPEQKFEDGQVSSDAVTQPISNNQNYDVLSGPTLESNDVNIKDDFNVKQQLQLQSQEQQQLQSQQPLQEQPHVHPEAPSGAIGPVETIRIIDESNRNGQGRSVKTVQIYNEVVPSNLPGQLGSKTIKTIRVLDAHSALSAGGLFNNNNNGYLPPENSVSPGSGTVESIGQTDNGYLPPISEEIKGQTVSDNGYLPPQETLPQVHPETPTVHQLLPPLPQINAPETSENNGYLPPVGEPQRLNLHSSLASSQPLKQETNNGYLPPPPPQNIIQQDNGYLPPIPEAPRINLHSSVASSQPIIQDTNNGYLPPPPSQDQQNNGYLPPPPTPNQEIQQQNNGYLPPVGELPRINLHSSVASSQPIRQETNNGYLPPLPSQDQQNNGYLPPIENPPPSPLNVHQLLPPLPELPKSHSHNEILAIGEPQTNNGYLPPAIHQHESTLPTTGQELQNSGQYQAPGYLPPVPETPPIPVSFPQDISSSLPISSNGGQYQAPGYLPPHSELSEPSTTNNGYLPPVSNSIESLAQQSIANNVQSLPPQQSIGNNVQSLSSQQSLQSSKSNVKVLRIIHEKKQRPVSLSSQQQLSQSSSPLQQQQIIQQIPSTKASIADQQAIYAAAGQAVNSNVKTIRIIHERTAKTLQGRYGNSKTYLPPSIRVIRVFKKK